MIPIAMPLLEETEAEAARQAVLSAWVSQGPEVAAFEREFATLVGAPHACAVSSARLRYIWPCWPLVWALAMR